MTEIPDWWKRMPVMPVEYGVPMVAYLGDGRWTKSLATGVEHRGTYDMRVLEHHEYRVDLGTSVGFGFALQRCAPGGYWNLLEEAVTTELLDGYAGNVDEVPILAPWGELIERWLNDNTHYGDRLTVAQTLSVLEKK